MNKTKWDRKKSQISFEVHSATDFRSTMKLLDNFSHSSNKQSIIWNLFNTSVIKKTLGSHNYQVKIWFFWNQGPNELRVATHFPGYWGSYVPIENSGLAWNHFTHISSFFMCCPIQNMKGKKHIHKGFSPYETKKWTSWKVTNN